MKKATGRILEGSHTVQVMRKRFWFFGKWVPKGATEERYIYDDGEYTVIKDTSNGKVFEGFFYKYQYGSNPVVSPEWLAKYPDLRNVFTLRRFKLIK